MYWTTENIKNTVSGLMNEIGTDRHGVGQGKNYIYMKYSVLWSKITIWPRSQRTQTAQKLATYTQMGYGRLYGIKPKKCKDMPGQNGNRTEIREKATAKVHKSKETADIGESQIFSKNYVW